MDIARKAIWFVESHYRNAPTLGDIAANCGVSPFHLTRSFAAVTGRSLMRYVRARRLSEAAKALATGGGDILSIALEWGYGSHEAFTRAFGGEFGITPEKLRAVGLAQIKITEAMTMHEPKPAKLEPPRFEMTQPRTFAGIEVKYDCEKPVGIPDQWQNFGPYIGKLKGQVGESAYGVCHNFDENGDFDYLTAVEVVGNPTLPKGFKTLKAKAQRYVVFRHQGHVADIRSTISTIWSEWFPHSGAKAVEAPILEVYTREFNPQTGIGGIEVWIAVE